MTSSDDQTVRSAMSGDAGAFGRLVSQNRAYVHAYVLSRVGDFAWAEDIAQEVFVAAFAGIGGLRRPSSFRAWLRGIADNLCALWLRRTERYARLRGDAAGLAADRPSSAREAKGEAVLSALARLTPANAAAVTLYYCDGLTQQECGEFLGVSRKAVESRLRRARAVLRKEVLGMARESMEEHAPDDSFDEAVMREVRRLAAVVGAERGPQNAVRAAEDRLRVLFGRSSARLAEFVGEARNASDIRTARRMTQILGRDGVDALLPVVLGPDEAASRQALAALPGWEDGTFAYVVLEAVHESAFAEPDKLRLLMELIRRPGRVGKLLSKADRRHLAYDSGLFTEMLMLHGARAAEALRAALAAEAGARKRPDGWLARALVRFGTAGIDPVTEWVEGAPPMCATAVALFRMLVEGLYLYRRCRLRRPAHELSEADFWLKVRGLTMPAVHPTRIAPESLARIGGLVAETLHGGQPSALRDAAFAIGHFDDEVALPAAERALHSGDLHVASALALSLGRRPSVRRTDILLDAVERSPDPLRKAAAESLNGFWLECLSLPHRRGESDPLAGAVDMGLAPAVADLEELLRAFDRRLDRIRACGEPANMLRQAQGHESPSALIAMVSDHVRRGRELDRIHREESELRQRASAYHEEHPDVATGRDAGFYLNLPAAVRAIPEDRGYREKELNRLIGRTNEDVSLARRRLYEEGWMDRKGDRYRFTDRGRRAWRMEHLLAAIVP